MREAPQLVKGQEVVVSGQIFGERGQVQTVVGIGPKWITIADRHGTKRRFHPDTQRDEQGFNYFRTHEQVLKDRRWAEAKQVLRSRRIMLEAGNTLTLEQVEALADVARTFPTDTTREGT